MMKHFVLLSVLIISVFSVAQFAQGATLPPINLTSNMGVGSMNSTTLPPGQVTLLQDFLRRLGYFRGQVTGYFGSITNAAVINFQTTNLITGDSPGFVGEATRSRINNRNYVAAGGTYTNPPPTNHTPDGWFDSLSATGLAQGWAYDPDASSTSIAVHMYIDNVFVASIPTNGLRTDVNQFLGITGSHGWSYQLPASYQTGSHSVIVYGIDTSGYGNTPLQGSPKSFPLPTGNYIDPNFGPIGTQVTIHGSGFPTTGNSTAIVFCDGGTGTTASSLCLTTNTHSGHGIYAYNQLDGAIWDLNSSDGNTLTFTLPPNVFHLFGMPLYPGTTYDLFVVRDVHHLVPPLVPCPPWVIGPNPLCYGSSISPTAIANNVIGDRMQFTVTSGTGPGRPSQQPPPAPIKGPPTPTAPPPSSSDKVSMTASLLQQIRNLLSSNTNYMEANVRSALVNLFNQLERVNGQ